MKRPTLSLAGLRRLRAAFDARARRERLLLAAAGVACAFMITDAIWLTPALQQWSALQAQRAGAATERGRQQQVAQQALLQQADEQRRLQAELKAVRASTQATAAALQAYQAGLVGPERMLPLLEQLLAANRQVRVRQLKTMPRSDLLAAAAPATPDVGAAAKVTPPAGVDAAAQRPTLYRHGVELTIEGRYADLMAYVGALEALPQRLLWGGMRFQVEQHPRALLTLQLYTLSTAAHWIEI